MGEQSLKPKDNGGDSNEPEVPEDVNMEMQPESDLEDDFDDMTPEEFAVLDNQLDALNDALDDIEQKNDDIHAQLLQLLEENREIRRQMQESNSMDDSAESP